MRVEGLVVLCLCLGTQIQLCLGIGRAKRDDFLGGFIGNILRSFQPSSSRLLDPSISSSDSDPAGPRNSRFNGPQGDSAVVAPRVGQRGCDEKLCRYLACIMRNFRTSDGFTNLNLMSQVLADPALRKSVLSDPMIIQAACAQANLPPEQCNMFQQGLGLFDRAAGLLGGRNHNSRPVYDHVQERRKRTPTDPSSFYNSGDYDTHNSGTTGASVDTGVAVGSGGFGGKGTSGIFAPVPPGAQGRNFGGAGANGNAGGNSGAGGRGTGVQPAGGKGGRSSVDTSDFYNEYGGSSSGGAGTGSTDSEGNTDSGNGKGQQECRHYLN